MSLGENVRAPLPTWTEMVAADTTAAEAAATRAVEKYILRFDILTWVLLKEYAGVLLKQDTKGIDIRV